VAHSAAYRGLSRYFGVEIPDHFLAVSALLKPEEFQAPYARTVLSRVRAPVAAPLQIGSARRGRVVLRSTDVLDRTGDELGAGAGRQEANNFSAGSGRTTLGRRDEARQRPDSRASA
jgi:hypothetical protein